MKKLNVLLVIAVATLKAAELMKESGIDYRAQKSGAHWVGTKYSITDPKSNLTVTMDVVAMPGQPHTLTHKVFVNSPIPYGSVPTYTVRRNWSETTPKEVLTDIFAQYYTDYLEWALTWKREDGTCVHTAEKFNAVLQKRFNDTTKETRPFNFYTPESVQQLVGTDELACFVEEGVHICDRCSGSCRAAHEQCVGRITCGAYLSYEELMLKGGN